MSKMSKTENFIRLFLLFWVVFYIVGIFLSNGEVQPWLWEERKRQFLIYLGAFFSAVLSGVIVIGRENQ